MRKLFRYAREYRIRRRTVKNRMPRSSHRETRSDGVQVIDRAVRLLDLIGEQEGIALTPLSTGSNLALSTTKRILNSLTANGLVEQSGQRYRLGPRLQYLASQAPSRRSLIELARPVLDGLARRAGEDVGLGVLRGGQPLIIDHALGPQPLKIVEPKNDRVPLNCGWRRVLLAFQPQEWIDEYLRTMKFRLYTKTTITSKAAIRQSLEAIRRNRIAVSYEEYVKDAVGIAAPVFDVDDVFVATIFLIAPLSRAPRPRVHVLQEQVGSAATTLTDRLRGKVSKTVGGSL